MLSRIARPRRQAFTLVELVIVAGIIVLLTVLLRPAFTNMRAAGNLEAAAQEFADTLDQARSYAVANNTYVWVGIYEENAAAVAASNSTPPYPGRGRVVLAVVASKDGTEGCQDPSSSTANRIPLIASQIIQVGKLVKIEGTHVTDIGPPTPPVTATDHNSISNRSNQPYALGSPTLDYQNRISSDDAHSPYNQTLYPFVAQGYTFYKTIRFNPRGEANINSTYSLRRVAEIGMRATHSLELDRDESHSIAIQFSGIAGKCTIYRK